MRVDLRGPHLATVTLYQFNTLDMDARASYLWANGDYITGMIDAQPDREIIALIAYLQRLGTDVKAQGQVAAAN